MCEDRWKFPIKMWRNFKGKFEGLKMANLTDWSREREGWWMGVEMGWGEGWMEGKGQEKGGKIWWKWEWLGVVWWWGLMPKKVPKNGSSSKNYPPLQNVKCYQSAPYNCDYMVNLIPSPYIPIGKLGYKAIPTKPIGIPGIWQLLEKPCFCNFSRVYITIFFFSGMKFV